MSTHTHTVNLYLGIDSNESGEALPFTPGETEVRLAQATELVARQYGGVTVIRGTGGWIHEDKLVTERSVWFRAEGVTGETSDVETVARSLAAKLAGLFLQYCVACTVEVKYANVTFVRPDGSLSN